MSNLSGLTILSFLIYFMAFVTVVEKDCFVIIFNVNRMMKIMETDNIYVFSFSANVCCDVVKIFAFEKNWNG